jgi:hypothetical protein
MSAKRKQSAVLRLLRNEDPELASRELAVPAAEPLQPAGGTLARGLDALQALLAAISVVSAKRTSIRPVSAAMVGSVPSIRPSSRMVSIFSRLLE